MNYPAINEDVLEIIEVYVGFNASNKNGDKSKIRQCLTQLFTTYLEFEPKPSPSLMRFSLDAGLITAIDSIERKLYRHNFSYARCVKDKLDAKSSADTKRSEVEEPDGEDMDEEEPTQNDLNNKDQKNDSPDKKDVKAEKDEDEDEPQREKNDDGKPQINEKEEEPKEEDGKEEDGDEREDSFDKYLESNSNDSFKEQHTKPMVFKTQQEISGEHVSTNSFVSFVPKHKENSKVFFGGHQFYVCFRFYYTLFERFLKALELAREIPQNQDTQTMSHDEIEKLAQERYDTFKEILKLYLKESFDPSIYEDCLRCIFGRDAGFLFSIDKIVNNVIKNLPTDDLSTFVLETRKELFSKEDEMEATSEAVKYSTLSQKMR